MDDALLFRFLAGEASEAERERLRAALEADPSLADALFESAELERDLVEAHRRAAKPRRRLWFGLVAAALLAAAAPFLFLGRDDLPRVDLVEGVVSPPVSPGELLEAGRDLNTARGRIVLRYEDGTRVELGANSALTG